MSVCGIIIMQVALECASNIRMRNESVRYDNEKVTKLDMHDCIT